MPDEYRIYSPAEAQSVFVSRLLRRIRPGARRTAVRLAGEPMGEWAGEYDGWTMASDEAAAGEAKVVATSSTATLALAGAGDLAHGETPFDAGCLRFFDKRWALDQAAAAGIPVPTTWARAEDIESWPVFFKSAREGAGRIRGVARRSSDLPTAPDEPLIFQEVITGRGTHGFAFIARDGEVLVSHAHFERESVPRAGGSAVIIETCEDPRLAAHVRRLLGRTGYTGWGLAEFKFCPVRDDFVFMELNAKLWASCEFSFAHEPAFARSMFGAEPPSRGAPAAMVFLDRALARGPGFWPALAWAVLSGAEVRVYPGWLRQAVGGLLPSPLRRWAGSIWRLTRAG